VDFTGLQQLNDVEDILITQVIEKHSNYSSCQMKITLYTIST